MVKSSPAASAQKPSRVKLVKRLWQPGEDDVLVEIVQQKGPGNWAYIAKHLPGRIGKQCRERWYNHLCPSIKKAEWSPEEKWLLFLGHTLHGSQWRRMTALLPGRTDNSIKNCWNSSLKRLVGAFEERLRAALELGAARAQLAASERALLEEIERRRARAAQSLPVLDCGTGERACDGWAGLRRQGSPARIRIHCVAYNADKENNAYSCNALTPHGSKPCKSVSPPSTDHSILASNSKRRDCFVPLRSAHTDVSPRCAPRPFDAEQPSLPVTKKVICFDFYDLR